MKSAFRTQHNTHTEFVHLNIYNCTGCWECIKVCPNKVIDKSFLYIADILIHEQVLIYDAAKCTGCLKCVESCKFDAIINNKQHRNYDYGILLTKP